MRSPLSRLRRWLMAPDQPLAAIEVRQGSIGCVRLLREGGSLRLGTAALVELPPGAVVVSALEPNVRDAPAFERALRNVVEQAGLGAGSPVALVVPDAAARTVLLNGNPEGPGASLEDLVRFRLRKSVPFEIRDASVAGWRLPESTPGGAAVLAAVMARPVLASYEGPVEALGLRPGLLELSGLALMRFASGGGGDHLLVNLEPEYLTLVLSRGGRPLLVRTLPGGLAEGLDGVAREIRQTLLYHRDRLSGAELDGAALRAGDGDPVETLQRLGEELGREPVLVEPWRSIGAIVPGDRGGGLAGAAASLLADEAAA